MLFSNLPNLNSSCNGDNRSVLQGVTSLLSVVAGATGLEMLVL